MTFLTLPGKDRYIILCVVIGLSSLLFSQVNENLPPTASVIQQTKYAGTLKFTKIIGETDITPTSDRNLLPVRYTLNKKDDGTFYITASKENILFSWMSDKISAKEKDGTLVFSYPGVFNITLNYLNDEARTGTYSLYQGGSAGYQALINVEPVNNRDPDPFNGTFACTVKNVETAGDTNITRDLVRKMNFLVDYCYWGFVQVGELTALTSLNKEAKSQLGNIAGPQGLYKRLNSRQSLLDTYFLLNYMVGKTKENNVTFAYDDSLYFSHLGLQDDNPSENSRETQSFLIDGENLQAFTYSYVDRTITWPEPTTVSGSLWAGLSGIRVNEEGNYLEITTDPQEIKCGSPATIQIRVLDEKGKVKTDYDGDVDVNVLYKTPSEISSLPDYQRVSISKGVAQPIFLFTPKVPFSPDNPITSTTPLSGKVVLEVKLVNSKINPVEKEILIKSPLDFYIKRIRLQQGIYAMDSTVTLEYKSGDYRQFAPLPFIADHATAVTIEVGYHNTVPIAFSKIEAIPDITAELKLYYQGAQVYNTRVAGINTAFVFKDTYRPFAQMNLEDALYVILNPADLITPGYYTFEAKLKLPPTIDEIIAEQENNTKERSNVNFVATKPYRVLSVIGAMEGETPSFVSNDHLESIKYYYPTGHSTFTITNPNSTILRYYSGWVFRNTSWLGTMRVLSRYNKENKGMECQSLLVFASNEVVNAFAGGPGGVSSPLHGVAFADVSETNGLISAHELGHLMGLKDTYNPYQVYNIVKAPFMVGDPNPRRHDATDTGNFIQDNNIDFFKKMKALFDAPSGMMYDFMGRGTGNWIDRQTWNYLYPKIFALAAPMAKTEAFESADGYITISGVISKADSALLNPLLLMSQVPSLDDTLAGDYAVQFMNQTDQQLASFNFAVSFDMFEIGEVEHVPFLLNLPFPAGTHKVQIVKNLDDGSNKVLASQTLTDHAPTVALIEPKSGQLQQLTPVRWSASDMDGDALSYDVLYSPEDGKEIIIQSGLTETSFQWDTQTVPRSLNGYLTIVASDGFNEARAASEALIVQVDGFDENTNAVPDKFALQQNYPNPFNSSTTIAYSVQTTAHLNIKVFDITGKKLALLLNEKKNAGDYELIWNAENVPSGVYFCRMEAVTAKDKNTCTIKMVVIR